jgi:hypothetical protein
MCIQPDKSYQQKYKTKHEIRNQLRELTKFTALIYVAIPTEHESYILQ